jgi:predicted branched-subunit amino acid permease
MRCNPPDEEGPMPEPAAPVMTFTRAGMRRGFFRSQAFSIGIFVYGLAFGLVAAQALLTIVQALAMSMAIYSGSAQLAAVGVLASSHGPALVTAWVLFATIIVINARYILYSATLRPWMVHLSPLQAYGTLFFLGDGSWLLSMKAFEEGERDAGFVFGASIGAFVAWMVGTWLGCIAIGLAPDPRKLGLDFFLTAFAAAMMVGMIKGRRDYGVILVAAVVAMVTARMANFGAAVVASGLAGGLIAYLRTGPAKDA